MSTLPSPTWRFPPRNGGIDYVNDPSSTHFSDAPIAKLVRELIQNSLDAKHDGFDDPVTVTFSETTVKRGLMSPQGRDALAFFHVCFDKPSSGQVDSHAVGILAAHQPTFKSGPKKRVHIGLPRSPRD